MKTFAIARRILQQLRRDRRTLMLLLAAPLLLLTLIYWLFGAYGTNQAVALVTVRCNIRKIWRRTRYR